MERRELADKEFELKNKISEITGYIASDWPSIAQRRKLYDERARLEAKLEEIKNEIKKA